MVVNARIVSNQQIRTRTGDGRDIAFYSGVVVRDDGGDIVDTGDAIFRDQLQIIMSEDRWQEGAVASFSAWIAGHRGDLVSVDSFDKFVLIDQNPAIIVSWAGQNAAIFRIGYHAVVVGNFAEK